MGRLLRCGLLAAILGPAVSQVSFNAGPTPAAAVRADAFGPWGSWSRCGETCRQRGRSPEEVDVRGDRDRLQKGDQIRAMPSIAVIGEQLVEFEQCSQGRPTGRTCHHGSTTCPIGCQYQEPWGQWSACSRSCTTHSDSLANGTRHRSREDEDQFESCPVGRCIGPEPPSAWGAWSTCTWNRFGVGNRARRRTVTPSSAVPRASQLRAGEEEEVEKESCVVDLCSVGRCIEPEPPSAWGAWGSCSRTCGVGTRARRRAAAPSSAVPRASRLRAEVEVEVEAEEESCVVGRCLDPADRVVFPDQARTVTEEELETACSKQTCDPQIYLLSVNSSLVREDNLRTIDRINSMEQGWLAGPGPFLSLSYPEVAAYRQGEVPASREERDQDPAADAARAAFLAKADEARTVLWSVVALPVEVYTTDASNQGECSACAAFAVTAALETCVQRVVARPAFALEPPRGLSSQHLLDCAFGSPGVAGCDGGQGFRYLGWLRGRALDTNRQYPYIDSGLRFEGLDNDYRQCYQAQGRPAAVVGEGHSSWDGHTQRDIENLLLEGHAVVTTMEVREEFLFYKSGVYRSPDCEAWRLGPGREDQWERRRPLRHAVVIVGFGGEGGAAYWKVKNSWGENWGESGFFRIARDGTGHCGLGAHISVAVCRACSETGSCSAQAGGPAPPPARPPPRLPEEGIILGTTTFLATPQGGQGTLSCPRCTGSCPSRRPCRTSRRFGGRCCKPLGRPWSYRAYCPRRC